MTCSRAVLLAVLAAVLAAQSEGAVQHDEGLHQRALRVVSKDTPSQCFSEFGSGVKDSLKEMWSVIKSCRDDSGLAVWQLAEDAKDLKKRVTTELREAITNCTTSADKNALVCVSEVLKVVGKELVPALRLVGEALLIYVRYVTLAGLEVFGCSLLPGILPVVWNTLLDLIILGECLFKK